MTENEKIEMLMKPRIICLGEDTSYRFKKDDILIAMKALDPDEYMVDLEGSWYPIEDILAMPHLFRRLEWWEHRKPEEMPEYVKVIKTPDQIHREGEVYRVQWDEFMPDWGKSYRGFIVLYTNCYLPATSTEYQNK